MTRAPFCAVVVRTDHRFVRKSEPAAAAHASHLTLTAHAAEAAHHHRLGDLAHGLAVDGDSASGVAGRRHIVKGKLRGDVDRAAGDQNGAVGVDRVGVALRHCNGETAAGDLDADAAGSGLLRGVDAVVRGGNAHVAAVDLNIGALNALRGADCKVPAVDLRQRGALNAVGARFDPEAAAEDADAAEAQILVVLAVHAVLACGDREVAVRDGDGIVGLQRVGGAGDDIGSAGDLEIVLAGNAVVRGGNGQRSGAVQNQILFGEDDRVRVRLAVGGKGTGDAERVLAVRGGHEDLVRALDVDNRLRIVRHREPVEHQLHLRVLRRVHDDLRVLRRSGDKIGARLRDRAGLAVRQRDLLRVGEIRRLIQIALREKPGVRGLCLRRGALGRLIRQRFQNRFGLRRGVGRLLLRDAAGGQRRQHGRGQHQRRDLFGL